MTHSGTDHATKRLNFAAGLRALLRELHAWRGTLDVDIERAKQRGFATLAADLSALRHRVERVQVLGHDVQAAQRGEPC